MIKTREKIIVGFGSKEKAKNFCDLRGVISTSLKQKQNILQILTEMMAAPQPSGQKLSTIPEDLQQNSIK
jgi:hypothetical protein